MKAIRFAGAGRPLNLETVPDPEPGPGWVVVDIEAAGLCHSDLHIMSGMDLGDLTVKSPVTLGHEGAGVISAIGDGVRGFEVGDRVGIALVTHPVEAARFAPGVGHDGAFAERELAHVSTLVHIPDNVTFAEAAVATDSVATAYHAVRTAGAVRRGCTVGVIGLGGLGLNGVRIAHLLGATVYGVDINPAAHGPALEAGAVECFQDAGQLAARHPDVIVDFAGADSTAASAVQSVRPGGCVVLVGLGAPVAAIPVASLVMRNVRLVGSLGASKDELREVYDLIASGALKPAVQEVPFTELPAAMDRLARGEVRGRLYTRPRADLRVEVGAG
ncbi:zinc-binding dehydrogenase [Streptomyces sp. NBC_00083]|uniref:zinc-binding dehydrogenase n=1 Tax=Streptomyces sp. NBC_00083 TaxID=2975647 RepID=UPI0022532DEA|nr:zinc-binding dehydrogenase [Streptomyces sp. NBC_00083]MCX5384239.1 zinc-binding dehydrogenase [Streptomyces sp. NBC_00083]